MSVSIHEHEFVVAERDALLRERDHWKANHDNRVAAAKVLLDRPDIPFERVHAYRAYVALQEQVDALRKQLRDMEAHYKAALEAEQVRFQQLAASQPREQQLREALLAADAAWGKPQYPQELVANALAMPKDATYLQSLIAKAGEVMRKRALVPCDDLSENDGNSTECRAAAGLCGIAIDALPAITMDDLKGGA